MNHPPTFISTVSSLHPIDLTAFAMMHVISPFDAASEILVLFMKELDVPSKLAHRILTARSSVPTPLLLLEKGDVFRQVFVPLIDEDTPANIEATLFAADIYINQLKTIFPSIADTIESRKNTLRDVLQGARSKDAEGVLLQIIQLILSDIIGKQVRVDSYDRYLKSEIGQTTIIAAITRIIDEVNLLNERWQQYKFTKGGYISVHGEDVSARLEYFETFEHKTIFWDEGQTVYLEIDCNFQDPALYHQQRRRESNFTLELRGPLHMIYQAQIGYPIDVPWYFDSVSLSDSQHAYDGIESISPISVSCSARISIWAGGENIRLHPSGYTLLDYNHPTILAYVSSIAESGTVDFNAYEDWRHIFNNYPVSRQRLLKSQSSIPKYCDLRLHDQRNRIIQGDESCFELLSSPLCFTVPQLGKTALSLMTIIKFLRDAMASPQVKWTSRQLKLLQDLDFLRDSIPALDTINYKMREITNHIDVWIQKIALRDTIVAECSQSDALTLIACLDGKKQIERVASYTQGISQDLVSLDVCYRILQRSLYLYYKAVVAFGGTVLKANLWTCWLLLGSDDCLKAFQDLVDQRGVKQLNLTAKTWSLCSDSSDVLNPR